MQHATGLKKLAAANVVHCHGAKGVSVTFPTGFKFTYSGDCRPTRSLTEIGLNSTVLLHEATFDDELRGDAQAKLHSTTSEAIGIGVAMGAQRILLTHFSQRYQKLPVMDMVDANIPELEYESDGVEGDPMAPMDLLPGTGVDGKPATEASIGEMVEDGRALDDLLTGGASASSNATAGSPDGVRIRKVDGRSYRPLHDMKVGVAFDYMRVKVKDIALLEKFTPALMKLYDQGKAGDSESGLDRKKGLHEESETRVREVNRAREKKTAGGMMPRFKQTKKEKERAKDGSGLFDERDGGETKLALANSA